MLANANVMDPWTQTIGLLGTTSRLMAAVEGNAQSRRKAQCADGRFGAAVTLIDRPTPSTATIAWRDSTRGCFGDQVWRMARARMSGFCAMSGQAIHPGDAVYKPNPRPAPVNAEAMILASVLRDAATAEG
ncbi:DUF3331 domain-containing protein [Paraburkholderia sabiae]|uniref:DUF3331 domain-containing protein n=1 Tax=Paraburkholderia sabiae TaxID=273251 RepID=A0ABU9Q892_9BURK|nr:DUF3331 domain-containing protein [Paraburkholderia sabiae]WJZ77747.1 DUF3331 domain-containing protein [Paraburkholderia sabiae]CAD6532685.1 hypothetical protein LMG24235_02655 [Paraburkholderia sabiae]